MEALLILVATALESLLYAVMVDRDLCGGLLVLGKSLSASVFSSLVHTWPLFLLWQMLCHHSWILLASSLSSRCFATTSSLADALPPFLFLSLVDSWSLFLLLALTDAFFLHWLLFLSGGCFAAVVMLVRWKLCHQLGRCFATVILLSMCMLCHLCVSTTLNTHDKVGF